MTWHSLILDRQDTRYAQWPWGRKLPMIRSRWAVAHLLFHDRQNVVYAAVAMRRSWKRSCMPMRRLS